MRNRIRLIPLLGAVMTLAFIDIAYTPPAEAVPAFARRTNKPCSGCHTAWPLLNKDGRKFRENGFKFDRKDKPTNIINQALQLDDEIPVSAILVARPFDKKSSGDPKVRALHEVEVMISGTVARDVSAFFEIEAEDENDFEPEIGEGRIGYHPYDWLNFLLSWGGVFTADNYDTLAGSRRMSRGRNAVIDKKFGNVDNDGRLRDPHQTIQVYGRPIKPLFYNIGFGGVANDAEAVNPNNFNGRLAFDVTPNIMVGTFGVVGQCEVTAANCASDLGFHRAGVDVQADISNVRIMGAFMSASDDRLGGAQKNQAWFLEGLYVLKKGDRPLIVPSLRIDWYEENDGADRFTEGTLNVTYFLWENVKAYLELFKQFNVPTGKEEDERITVQIAVGF